ncbi:unnamed protein product [Prorocentrum cordatum]|uniref:Uncharacterized protein n=1 Tax=Prorocentrum cordatum TaxID=2364126 RepID=A0ABN9R3P3_9DINO|nr:unnamed protein product [Polarella glacialis]
MASAAVPAVPPAGRCAPYGFHSAGPAAAVSHPSGGRARSKKAALGSFAAATGPARKRVSAACEHLAALRHMAGAKVHEQVDQTVWSIMQQSIARAIEYDMRLCPWQLLEEHAARLETECWHPLELLMGASMDSHAQEQASLPGWFGGLSLALPSKLRAAAAFPHCCGGPTEELSALPWRWGGRRPAVPQMPQPLPRRLRACGWLSSPSGRERPRLSRLRPAIAAWRGLGCRTSQPRQSSPSRAGQRRALRPSRLAGARCPVAMARRLLGRRPARASNDGRVARSIDAPRATELHAFMLEHCQICILSSGGEGTSIFWSTVPARPPLRTPSAQWALAPRSRLGGEDDPCGDPLDSTRRQSDLSPE